MATSKTGTKSTGGLYNRQTDRQIFYIQTTTKPTERQRDSRQTDRKKTRQTDRQRDRQKTHKQKIGRAHV